MNTTTNMHNKTSKSKTISEGLNYSLKEIEEILAFSNILH